MRCVVCGCWVGVWFDGKSRTTDHRGYGGTRVPGTGYTAPRGTAYVRCGTRVTSISSISSSSRQAAHRSHIPPTTTTRYGPADSLRTVALLCKVYIRRGRRRSGRAGTGVQRSPFLRESTAVAAVLQVFPGPCTAPHKPTHHPTTHHTPHTPHSSQGHFRLRMPRFLPFLVPMPPADMLSRPPTPTPTPTPCPRPLTLPTLPSAAAARALAPAPPARGPFPHCAFPSGSRAPFPHVHSIHVSSRRSVSLPSFPTYGMYLN